MALTEEQKAKCIEWVKGYANKWQTASRGTWRYQFHEKTLVRFVTDVTVREDLADILLEYLTSDDCIETLSLYDQKVDKAWKPIRAWYELGGKSVGSIGGMRLMHAMTIDPEAGADGPYVSENGCFYKVNLTYYWKKPSVEPLPESSSGVSYQITGLSRDNETGLFSYAVEERIRIQRDVELYNTTITSFEKRQEELHLGVKADSVSSTGKAASVNNGVITERRVTKNSDCTSDVQNVVITEQPKSNVVIVKRKSVRGVTTSVTDRNQSSCEALLDPSGIGEMRRSEMTDGGLYNNTHETFKADGNNDLSSRDDNTVFESASETITAQDEKPTDKITDAGSGKYYSRTVRANDEGGYDVTDRTTEEKAVSDAVVVKRKSVRGVTTSVTKRNQDKAEVTENTELTEIGETRRSEKTPGGLYNNTIETFKADGNNDLSSRDDNTVFESASETITAQDEKPTDKITDAGDGKYYSRTVRANDEGGYDVTDRTTEEKAQSNAVVVKRKTLNGVIVSTTNRNQTSADTDTEPSEIGETRRSEMTPGGLYNNTVETFDVNQEETLIDESIVEDNFKQDYSSTTNKPDFEGVGDREDGEYFSEGGITQVRYSKTEYGTTNESVREIKAKESWHEFSWTDSRGTFKKVVYVNQAESKVKDTIPTDAITSDATERINEFGLYDGTLTWKPAKIDDDDDNNGSGSSSGESAFIKTGDNVTVLIGRKGGKDFKKPQIRLGEVQLYWESGGAYTNYVDDMMSANINRKDEGTLAAKFIRAWKDSDGNTKAEWCRVDLASIEEWKDVDETTSEETFYELPQVVASMLQGISHPYVGDKKEGDE